MSTPILATKLYIPPLPPQVVRRPRLIERLNEGLPHRKLTLISAAAGFGKTTLVSEWINQKEKDEGRRMKDEIQPSTFNLHPFKVAWLSLDEGDNEPTRFLAYLIAALQTIEPTVGEETLAMLQSPQPLPTESLLTALINEITAVSHPFLLILDDYHLIDTPAIDKALIFLLEHQPPQMHLVIASREDPSLPLARYRVRGQLTELRAADLRFTHAETAGFLNQAIGLNLSEADIAALEARTEGWIAGLQLAALALQGQPSTQSQRDATNFIQSFTGSHHFVLDYLIEEVLHQQPEKIQTFLLCTSIFDRLCGSLCDAVLRDSQLSGQETLAYLERTNLFIVPLDNERRWYRYHHLFGDLLRQRRQLSSFLLGGTVGAAELHHRASIWFEENGFDFEAINHALAAKDFERVAISLELIWQAMDESFQTITWLAWANALPKAIFHNRPVLLVDYAWAHLNSGQMEAGRSYLQEVEQLLDTTARAELGSTELSRSAEGVVSEQDSSTELIFVDEKQFHLLPATIASAYGYHAQVVGDHAGAVKYSQQALDLLPEEEHIQRILTAGFLAIAYWANGDLDAAHQIFIELITNLRKAGHIVFATATTYGLATINITRGHLHETIRIYQQAIEIVQEQGEPPIQGTADQYLWLCDLYLEQGELEIAKQHLSKSEDLGQRAALQDWPHRLCLVQARVKEADGDLDGALERLDEAEAVYYPVPVPLMRPIDAQRARIWLKQGKLADAQNWVKAQNLSIDDELNYLHEFEYITLARVKIAEGKNGRSPQAFPEARKLLNRLLQAAEDGKRVGSMIEIFVLLAITHQAQGNPTLALEPLEHALTLAEPENYVRLFTDEGQPMAELLKRQKAEGKKQKDYAQKLLAAINDHEKTQPSFLNPQPLVEPLSERELEVLQLIAQGYSNREISEQLHVALSTVKGHNMRIFGKLGVQRRTEAVARARELRLLGS